MKITITAGRRDEIIEKRDSYKKSLDQWQSRQDARYQEYDTARNEILDPIRNDLIAGLSKFPKLQFDVDVESWSKRGMEVRIKCNERNKFDSDSALSWSYNAVVDREGNLKKETSSWSGLQATTAEQMDSLKQIVAALEYLNSIDWKELLDREMPNYNSFMDPNDTKPVPEMDYDAELKSAELEELVGTNKLIKVSNYGETSPYRGSYVWLKLEKETPSMYSAVVIPNSVVENYKYSPEDRFRDALMQYMNYSPVRIRKNKVHPVEPIEIVEV